MTDTLARVLPDLLVLAALAGLGVLAIRFGATRARPQRKILYVATGLGILLVTTYLVAAYLVTGPGRVLVS